MIVLKRKILSIAEYWFDEEIRDTTADVIRFVQRSAPVNGIPCSEFHTIIVDLSQSDDDLFESVGKRNKCKIRRACATDHLIYEYFPENNNDTIQDFVDFYNRFACQKHIDIIQPHRLMEYAGSGLLTITKVNVDEGQGLVWHVYFHSDKRVRCLYSASSLYNSNESCYRSLIGRANRYHHWQDMLRFKADGYSIYDFGGWYSGNKDRAKLAINNFKESFGGQIVKNYNSEFGASISGIIYLQMRNTYNMLMHPDINSKRIERPLEARVIPCRSEMKKDEPEADD